MKPVIHHPATLFWLPLLYGLQSIPGTGALRTLFLTCGLLHIVLLGKGNQRGITFAETERGEWTATMSIALTAWLAFHALFVAQQPSEAFATWLGEWSKVTLLAALGVGLVRRWPRPDEIPTALLAGALLHVLATLGYQATRLARGQPLEWGMSWLGNYGYASPFVTSATALLLADLVARAHGHRLFVWASRWSVVLLLLSLAAELALRAKAGYLLTTLLVVLALILGTPRLGFRHRLMWGAAVISTVVILLAAGYERWVFAWTELCTAAVRPPDVSTLLASSYLTDTLPKGGDGSFFLRLTWARMALYGILAHPEGIGYGGDAFGRWVEQRWGIPGAVSSHSGWLDFTLANGVIGATLLLSFVATLLISGWRAWVKGRAAGLALVFLGFHFFLRGGIDGLFYGSRLSAAALAIGILFASSHARRPD